MNHTSQNKIMLFRWFCIACFVFCSIRGYSQYYPSVLSCVSVQTNGDVTINWSPPNDLSAGFNSYLIYYSSNGISGSFVHISSIFNVNQTSFTHVGTPANFRPVAYYIVTRYAGNNDSPSSDTLQTMFLRVSDIGSEQAGLQWNDLHTTHFSSPLEKFYIYREYPLGQWFLTDSTTQLSQIDTLQYLCNKQVRYRIECKDTSGCSSVSTLDGKIFYDLIPPLSPVFDSISVDINSGNPILGWTMSPSQDTYGYFIYFGSNNLYYDTVWSRAITSYKDVLIDASTKSYQYTIAAFDSCNYNKSPLGLSFSTLFLRAKRNICAKEIVLTWTNSFCIYPSTDGYRIFVQKDNGAFILLADVNSSINTFTHSNLQDGSEYCYFIRAYHTSTGKTSSSNKACVSFAEQPIPRFVYLRYASVDNSTSISLKWYVDTLYPISYHKIMRSDDGVNYTEIERMQHNNTSNLEFIDNNVTPDNKPYYYKIITYDSCEIAYIESNTAKTIHLIGSVYDQLTNNIVWNNYEGFNGMVNSYNIYRNEDESSTPELYKNVASSYSGNDIYFDNLINDMCSDGTFYYIIEAKEGVSNRYGFCDLARSNRILIEQSPRIYFPNAFRPQSGIIENTIFMPISVFVNSTYYEFTIYDRNGHEVFFTTNTNEGWDGNYKGSPMATGVYAYVIKLKFPEGNSFEKVGTVTLFR